MTINCRTIAYLSCTPGSVHGHKGQVQALARRTFLFGGSPRTSAEEGRCIFGTCSESCSTKVQTLQISRSNRYLNTFGTRAGYCDRVQYDYQSMESLLVSHLNRNANLMISNPFVAPSTFPRQVGFCPKISWVKIHTGTQYLLSFLIWTVQRTSLLDALIVNISTLICDFTYCMSR